MCLLICVHLQCSSSNLHRMCCHIPPPLLPTLQTGLYFSGPPTSQQSDSLPVRLFSLSTNLETIKNICIPWFFILTLLISQRYTCCCCFQKSIWDILYSVGFGRCSRLSSMALTITFLSFGVKMFSDGRVNVEMQPPIINLAKNLYWYFFGPGALHNSTVFLVSGVHLANFRNLRISKNVYY